MEKFASRWDFLTNFWPYHHHNRHPLVLLPTNKEWRPQKNVWLQKFLRCCQPEQHTLGSSILSNCSFINWRSHLKLFFIQTKSKYNADKWMSNQRNILEFKFKEKDTSNHSFFMKDSSPKKMGSLSRQISLDQRSSSKNCYILKLFGLLLCLVIVIISVSLLVTYVPILINVIGRQSRSKKKFGRRLSACCVWLLYLILRLLQFLTKTSR